ncbi:glucan biosynthesis protein D [Cellvibrio sp. PSBB006]|nr:glucan biosynthesis protein D [Cellvibrio sp. PSBB006]
MLGSWLMTFLCFGVMVQAQQQTPASSVSSSSAVASPVVDPVIADPEPNALFNAIEARAKSLAQDDFKPIEANIPDELANMNYDQYRSIHFRPEASLWRGESLFEIQLFHPGFLYREPVVLHMASSVGDPSLKFKQDFFNYVGQAEALAGKAPENIGFAGFRVHYPLNTNEYKDEFLVFQGASYFRLVGPGQVYGLSARGLAIDTAESSGEEFPVFREFWLVKPEPDQTRLVLYALLDSPSVTGAYRFEITPGAPTEMGVEARLFARRDIKKLGIAPLTSMFHHGENTTRFVDDFRPEVHDSDGLLVAAANGEWIWRPLSNQRALRVSSLADENPRGFGLLQRDRDFNHYLDMEADYELRPSLWVMPQGDWGKGRVELVEIPTDSEVNDNIVAYWVPEQAFKAGETRRFSYRLRTFDQHLAEQGGARVLRTRIGWGAVPGQSNPPPHSKRQFVIDFRGGELENLSADVPLEAELQKNSGTITDLMVTRLPDQKTWRVSFKLEPEGNNLVDMRMFIKLRDQRLTEVWSYVWYPDAIQ